MKKFVILTIAIVICIIDVNAHIFYPLNGEFTFQNIHYKANHNMMVAETASNYGQPSGKIIIPTGADRCSCPIRYKVVKIGDDSFSGCTGLTQVYLPYTIKSIGNCAFKGCSNLTYIDFPADWVSIITEIGISAFEGCSSLTSIDIPSSVDMIGGYAFYGCSSLKKVKFSKSTNLNILGSLAFAECKSLTDISIPKGVWIIGHGTFKGCTSLKYVELPVATQIIKEFAFQSCSSLPEITIPENVADIRKMAFAGCSSLSTVILPSSLKSLGEAVWWNCRNIKTVVCMGQNPVEAGTDIFDETIYYNATLWVPKGTKDIYKKTNPWSRFSLIVEGDPAGIEDVFMDDATIDYSQPYEIYNSSGVKICRDISALSTGIYIIRQGYIIKKVVVK